MRSNGLWETAQAALDNNISLRATIPGSRFVVIPFGDNPYEIISFNNAGYPAKKPDISSALTKHITQARFTNISSVLESGFGSSDPNKENEIYLFTDGMPNNGDTPQRVAETIMEWCGNHRNAKLYYVALKNGVINPVIQNAIDECDDASIVQCENGIVPIISNISSDIYTNLEELGTIIEIPYSIPGEYNLTSSCTDDLFDFNIEGNKSSKGKIRVKIMPRGNISIAQLHQTLQGEEYEFAVSIQCTDHRFVISNPTVNVHVSDEVPSKLSIAAGVDELQADGVCWYDSFLWSDCAPDAKIVWDLTPVFKDELKSSKLSLKFHVAEGETDDFQAWFNGQTIGNNQTIEICPNQPACLEVQFNHDAKSGKRYFALTPTTINDIDIINEQPSEVYQGTSLRTEYDVDWNPLKTFLFWLGIVLIAALVLWLAVLKKIFFPTIKMARITITGPGSYYSSKKIKGARKVVLTTKQKYQNIFSRIFTGEIRVIKAEHFVPELSIVPAGSKKKVRICSQVKINNPWDIYPATVFGQYEKGTISNKVSKDKFEIEFN